MGRFSGCRSEEILEWRDDRGGALMLAGSEVVVAQTPTALMIGGVIALSGLISPIILALLTNRHSRRMKLDDYERQDKVAKALSDRQDEAESRAAAVAIQAAEAARLLALRQDEAESKAATVALQAKEAARLLVESNRAQEEIARVQSAKLDQIHTLVNSNLTTALQDQLDTRRANLVLLGESIDIKDMAGLKPSPDVLGIMDATRIKIAELETQLADRLKQTTDAAKQLAIDLAKAGNGTPTRGTGEV